MTLFSFIFFLDVGQTNVGNSGHFDSCPTVEPQIEFRWPHHKWRITHTSRSGFGNGAKQNFHDGVTTNFAFNFNFILFLPTIFIHSFLLVSSTATTNHSKMASPYDSYQTSLTTRYCSKEMSTLFSQRSRHSTWRKLWLGLAESEKELGIDTITPEALQQMKAHLTVTDEDFEVARVEEKIRRHVCRSPSPTPPLTCCNKILTTCRMSWL